MPDIIIHLVTDNLREDSVRGLDTLIVRSSNSGSLRLLLLQIQINPNKVTNVH